LSCNVDEAGQAWRSAWSSFNTSSLRPLSWGTASN